MNRKRYPSCILATVCVPWNADGSLAEATLRREIRNLLTNLTRDLYLFGTAGEGYAVNDEQFDRIVGIFREETNLPKTRGMVGVIGLSLPGMIDRINRARKMGVHHFQISLPSWGALNDWEMKEFFRQICGRFPDCSFLHYNLLRAKRLITPDEYASLSEEHPNLVAAKNSTDSMGRIHELMTRAPRLQHFFTEAGYAYGSLIGQCGLLVSIASIHFVQAKRYFEAGRRRDVPRLLRCQRELIDLIADIVSHGGAEAHMDGAYDKIFCKFHDPEFPLRLLPPYAGLTDDIFHQIVASVRSKYPQWVAD